MNRSSSEFQSSGYFGSHKEYSSALRTWFVAYAIGGPALIASQEHLWSGLSYESAAWAGGFFLAALAFQIVPAAFYKWAMWELWIAINDETRKTKRRWKLAKWASEHYLIDLFTDCLTMALLIAATLFVGSGLLQGDDNADPLNPAQYCCVPPS